MFFVKKNLFKKYFFCKKIKRPSDALFSVAKEFMEPIELDKDTKIHCVEMVQFFHESTIQWAVKFYAELRRKYYVTPTSYLEMLSTF